MQKSNTMNFKTLTCMASAWVHSSQGFNSEAPLPTVLLLWINATASISSGLASHTTHMWADYDLRIRLSWSVSTELLLWKTCSGWLWYLGNGWLDSVLPPAHAESKLSCPLFALSFSHPLGPEGLGLCGRSNAFTSFVSSSSILQTRIEYSLRKRTKNT